jgi:uncharacterized membrane protein
MNTRLAHQFANLRTSFWFVPGLMVVAAVLLAAIVLWLDAVLAEADLPPWVYTGGADGARALLSTIAGSMVTVAGVGFSITIVALVLASTQFGPRLLILFLRDRTSQATLGIFVATFTYCVLVLRTIRGPEEVGGAFVPQVGMTVAIGITLLSVGVLVYFFHHVAVTIQAPTLVATVARDVEHAIDRLVHPSIGSGGPVPVPADVPDPLRDGGIFPARTGYVQVIDDTALFEQAKRHDLTIRILTRPGLFVSAANPVMAVRPAQRLDDRGLAMALSSTIIVGDTRTAEDDIEFSIRQLVEVALRALSPAINDPFTAMAAVDWLGAALTRLAVHEWPPRFRYDGSRTLRIVAEVPTFGGVTHTIFSRIRHYGGSSPVVLNRLLEAVAAFGPHVSDPEDRALVRDETDAVLRIGRKLIVSEADLRELEKRHGAALAALGLPHRDEDGSPRLAQ